MAERRQGQQRVSGTIGKYQGLISPGILRLELGLIPRNSWENFLLRFRRRPIIPAHTSPWTLSQIQRCRTQAPFTRRMK